jgi:hypothetical protein
LYYAIGSISLKRKRNSVSLGPKQLSNSKETTTDVIMLSQVGGILCNFGITSETKTLILFEFIVYTKGYDKIWIRTAEDNFGSSNQSLVDQGVPGRHLDGEGLHFMNHYKRICLLNRL